MMTSSTSVGEKGWRSSSAPGLHGQVARRKRAGARARLQERRAGPVHHIYRFECHPCVLGAHAARRSAAGRIAPAPRSKEIVHLDHGVAQGVSALDHGVFLVGQAAGRIGGVGDVAHVGLRIAVQRAALFQLADLGLDGFGLQRGGQRQFDGAYRLVGGGGQVAAGGQAITGGARVDQQLGDLLAQFVRGQRLRMAPGEDDAAQAQATKRFG